MSSKTSLQIIQLFGFVAGCFMIFYFYDYKLFLGILFLLWANNANNEIETIEREVKRGTKNKSTM